MRYRVLRGCNYPPGDRRAEPGETVSGLSSKAVAALRRLGAIEPIESEEPE